MAKLPDVDHEEGLPPSLRLNRKAIEPGLKVVIGHRGATVEPFQLEHPPIYIFEQHAEVIAVQLRADAGIACHQGFLLLTRRSSDATTIRRSASRDSEEARDRPGPPLAYAA